MNTILICDDDKDIVSALDIYLTSEGYATVKAYDGLECLRLAEREPVDLILLDVMMPEMDGFDAVRSLRAFSSAPVIMLSARSEELDRIHGFSLGVDDYVSKPFSPRELMMRIAAIRKRTSSAGYIDTVTGHFGEMTTEAVKKFQEINKLTVDGKRVDLSPKEYELLFFLVRNRNIALTREKLICEVWGYDFTGDERTLDTHIKLLRKRLGPYAGCIVTMRGVGYRFEA